jgi:hypothetical protein
LMKTIDWMDYSIYSNITESITNTERYY